MRDSGGGHPPPSRNYGADGDRLVDQVATRMPAGEVSEDAALGKLLPEVARVLERAASMSDTHMS